MPHPFATGTAGATVTAKPDPASTHDAPATGDKPLTDQPADPAKPDPTSTQDAPPTSEKPSPAQVIVTPSRPIDSALVAPPTVSAAAHSLLAPPPLPTVPIVVPMPLVEVHPVPSLPDPAPELSAPQQAALQHEADSSSKLDAMVSNMLKVSSDTSSTIEGTPKP